MSVEYLRAFSPLFALILNILFQILIYRSLRFSLLKTLFSGFLMGLVFLIGLEVTISVNNHILTQEFLGLGILNLISYVSLSYCYFHFVNLGETDRRIRILYELYESNCGLTFEEIIDRYNSGAIIEKRLKRLLDHNQVVLLNNKYYVNNHVMKYISSFIFWMKVLFIKDQECRK